MTLLRRAIVESSVKPCQFAIQNLREATNEPPRIALGVACATLCSQRMGTLAVKDAVMRHGGSINERRVTDSSCLGLPGGNKVVGEDDVIVR